MGRRGRQRRVIHDEDDDLDHTYDKLPSRRATKTVSYKETDEDEDVVEELGGIKDVPDDAALNINEVEAPDLKDEDAVGGVEYGENGEDGFPGAAEKDHILSRMTMNLKKIKLKNPRTMILFYLLMMRNL